MECSAKDNYNVTELFKTLLSLSKLMPTEHPIETHSGPFKRRSSAYVSATSKGKICKKVPKLFSFTFKSLQEETEFRVLHWEMRNLLRSMRRQVSAGVKHLDRMSNQSRDQGKKEMEQNVFTLLKQVEFPCHRLPNS